MHYRGMLGCFTGIGRLTMIRGLLPTCSESNGVAIMIWGGGGRVGRSRPYNHIRGQGTGTGYIFSISSLKVLAQPRACSVLCETESHLDTAAGIPHPCLVTQSSYTREPRDVSTLVFGLTPLAFVQIALDRHQLPHRALNEVFSETNKLTNPACGGCVLHPKFLHPPLGFLSSPISLIAILYMSIYIHRIKCTDFESPYIKI